MRLSMYTSYKHVHHLYADHNLKIGSLHRQRLWYPPLQYDSHERFVIIPEIRTPCANILIKILWNNQLVDLIFTQYCST